MIPLNPSGVGQPYRVGIGNPDPTPATPDPRCSRCFCPVPKSETLCGDCAEARQNGLPDKVRECSGGSHSASFYYGETCKHCGQL